MKTLEMDRIPLAVVVGPTASGKTALAVELACMFGGEVVSADSMQIYRGLDIGTAKPAEDEKKGIPHHLIGFWDPREPFSVAQYVELARDAIADIHRRGKLPVVAGGTGLYVDSLTENILFSKAEGNPELRRRLMAQAQEQGGQALLEELAAVDPQAARGLHPNNVGRIVRALEVYRETGVPISEHKLLSRRSPSPYECCFIGLNYRNRQTLYGRINCRVDQMLADGLIQEAWDFFQSGEAATAAQAIGYKELFWYFRGECTLAESAELIKRGTRRYAKRQLTWFRRNPSIHWLYGDDYQEPRLMTEAAAGLLRQRGIIGPPIKENEEVQG